MTTLLVVAAAAVAPSIAAQIRRDREEELIHRGMQYRRAIRRFIKQTGRYPTRIEDLDTGSVRYLRKRYKDPITGQDFKLLHMLDVPQLRPAGASPLNASLSTADNHAGGHLSHETPAPADAAVTGNGTAGQVPPNDNDSQPAAAAGSAANGTSPVQRPANFGGGLIIGVASISPRSTIREFNHKNHYNQWLFFYDPALERGPETYGPTPIGLPAPILQNQAQTGITTAPQAAN